MSPWSIYISIYRYIYRWWWSHIWFREAWLRPQIMWDLVSVIVFGWLNTKRIWNFTLFQPPRLLLEANKVNVKQTNNPPPVFGVIHVHYQAIWVLQNSNAHPHNPQCVFVPLHISHVQQQCMWISQKTFGWSVSYGVVHSYEGGWCLINISAGTRGEEGAVAWFLFIYKDYSLVQWLSDPHHKYISSTPTYK